MICWECNGNIPLPPTLLEQLTRYGQHKLQMKKETPFRSSLHVRGICCRSEEPAVKKILLDIAKKKSLHGSLNKSCIKKIAINITSRIVYVDHDDNISVMEMVENLNQGGFQAKVIRNGAQCINPNFGDDKGLNHMEASPLVLKSNYVESILIVPEMSSQSHINDIQIVLKRQNLLPIGIRAFYPHVLSRSIKLEHNPNITTVPTIVKSIMDAGFVEVNVHVDGDKEGLVLPSDEENGYNVDNVEARHSRTQIEGKVRVNVILSGFFWFVSIVGRFHDNWNGLQYFGILSVIFGLPPVINKAFRTLRRFGFDANCMMVFAACGSLALQEYEEAASVSFLFAVSEWLEDRATSRARSALDAIVQLRPDHANVIDHQSQEITIVPAHTVKVGSLVSVRTGDKFPADGKVLEGFSQADESSLTGEAMPVDKHVGDIVSAGSINIGSTRLIVKTTSSTDNSTVSRLIRLVEEAQANKSPTEKRVDSFARSYTPIVISLAILMCTLPWIFGTKIGKYWTLNGLILVVVACPCALTISTPVTYAAGLAATAQNGIIVKGGATLESLGSVKKVVFDKTGTLTEGKFLLLHLSLVGNSKTRKEVMELLILMESPSSHPLARTLVNAAKAEGARIPKGLRITNHSTLKGEGVTAICNNERIYVGNARLFKRLNLFGNIDSALQDTAEKWDDDGGTVGFLGTENYGVICMFCLSDTVRKEAKDTVAALLKENFEVKMLTGDGDGASRAVARDVGIEYQSIHSQLLPEDKLLHLKSMHNSTKDTSAIFKNEALVLMIGDGVNDAPALAYADVSVAMGEGASIAMEISDVTLMDCNLEKLLFSIKIGRKVIVTIEENICFSILSKLAIVALAFLGKVTLLGAIASDVGVMLFVTLNGMRLLPSTKKSVFRVNSFVRLTSFFQKKRNKKHHYISPVYQS